MDKEAKNFFEKLSGVKDTIDDTEEEIIITTPALNETEEEEDEEDAEEESEEENGEVEFSEDAEGKLTVDVYETPSAFVVKSAIAGVNPENLDISITNESISIRGNRSEEEKVKAGNYLVQECYWGKFARSIILSQEVDPDKSTAALKNGILKITLPKVSKNKSKKLKIKFE